MAGANARTEDGEAAESEGEKLTKEIDALGMRWLCMALYPLVGAWGVYSLLYYPHKSWWSWLINTLANFSSPHVAITLFSQNNVIEGRGVLETLLRRC